MRNKCLKIALIGAGKIAVEYLNVLRDFDDVSLCGIANRSGIGLEELCNEYSIEKGFNDWQRMLEKTKPDAALILVSCDHIAGIAEVCLKNRIPCFIEKPVGLFSTETKKIYELSISTNCIHQIALNRRFYSVVNQAIDEVLKRGPIHGVHVEDHEPIDRICNKGKHGNTVLDRWMIANGIHAVDLFRYVGGAIKSVSTHSFSYKHTTGDAFGCLVQFESGTIGTFNGFWRSTGSVVMTIYGEGIRACLNGGLMSGQIFLSDGRCLSLNAEKYDKKYKPGFYYQMREFVDAVKDGRKPLPPAATMKEYFDSFQLAEKLII